MPSCLSQRRKVNGKVRKKKERKEETEKIIFPSPPDFRMIS